jgi:hypothetical protein
MSRRIEFLTKELINEIVEEYDLDEEDSEDVENRFKDMLDDIYSLVLERDREYYLQRYEKERKQKRTPYMNFIYEMEPIIERENPKMSKNQITARLEKIWDTLPPERKKKYNSF